MKKKVFIFILNCTIVMVAQGTPSTQGINRAVKDVNYYLELRDFPAALAEAERIVLQQENSPGQPSLNKATALHSLANVQQVMHQHLKSEKNYKKSIQLIERQLGEHASELINVLNHLGLLYAGTSDYELATDAFRRAQHITHRIDGVYSLRQLKIVDWITLINIKTGQSRDADTQQHFYYSINLKNYGEDDSRMLPAMNKMADWFKATGQLNDALKTYEKALAVIEKNELGETEKLQPLRGISTVMYLKGSSRSDEPLDETLQIVTKDPDFDHIDELEALLHLADMQMIREKRGVARKYYQLAWNKLGSGNQLIDKLFSKPKLLGVSRIEDVSNAYFETVEGRAPINQTVYRMTSQDAGSFSFGAKPKAPSTPVIGEPLSLCHSRALELAQTDNTEDLEQYFVNELSKDSQKTREDYEKGRSDIPNKKIMSYYELRHVLEKIFIIENQVIPISS